MQKIKHTPAPWRHSQIWRKPYTKCYKGKTNKDGDIFAGYSISGSNEHGGDILPKLAIVEVFNFPDNIHANARLIAAAPELLDALCNLIDEIPIECDYHGNPMDKDLDAAIQTAEKIIKKAKGLQ